MTVGVQHYLALAVLLFCIGAFGVVLRRNFLAVLMSLEIMLNSANILLVAFARQAGGHSGQVMAFFVMALAAAEVATGLALAIAWFRVARTVNVDEAGEMKH